MNTEKPYKIRLVGLAPLLLRRIDGDPADNTSAHWTRNPINPDRDPADERPPRSWRGRDAWIARNNPTIQTGVTFPALTIEQFAERIEHEIPFANRATAIRRGVELGQMGHDHE